VSDDTLSLSQTESEDPAITRTHYQLASMLRC